MSSRRVLRFSRHFNVKVSLSWRGYSAQSTAAKTASALDADVYRELEKSRVAEFSVKPLPDPSKLPQSPATWNEWDEFLKPSSPSTGVEKFSRLRHNVLARASAEKSKAGTEFIERSLHDKKTGYYRSISNCEDASRGLLLLERMEKEGLTDEGNLTSAMYACFQDKDWDEVLRLHALTVQKKDLPNFLNYKLVLMACGHKGLGTKAIELLQNMSDQAIPPDSSCMFFAIKACTDGGKPQGVIDLFDSLPKFGLTPNVANVGEALKACKKGGLLEAEERLRQYFPKPARSLPLAEVTATTRTSKLNKALKLLDSSEKSNVTELDKNFRAALDICSRSGEWHMALKLLGVMITRNLKPCINSFTACISACAKGGEWERALRIFYIMQGHGVEPNEQAFHQVLQACARTGMHIPVLQILDLMDNRGVTPSTRCINAAMVAFSNSGKFEQVSELFDSLGFFGLSPDVHTYSIIITTCQRTNNWQLALKVLDSMDSLGLVPNVVTLSSAILACKVDGKWQVAEDIFNSMQNRNIIPNEYTFVAMFGTYRVAGRWESAMQLLDRMKMNGWEPNADCYAQVMAAIVKGGGSIDQIINIFEIMNSKGINPSESLFDHVLHEMVSANWKVDAIVLMTEARKRGLYSSIWKTVKESKLGITIDLSKSTKEAAVAALWCVLEEFKIKQRPPCNVVVVTNQWKRSLIPMFLPSVLHAFPADGGTATHPQFLLTRRGISLWVNESIESDDDPLEIYH